RLHILCDPHQGGPGPVKTGGCVFMLDHMRWTPPLREVIDGLLQKHNGEKEILKVRDEEYADLVCGAAKDPKSFLHPRTRRHFSWYEKHLVKLLNHKP
ncbi:hypothetical protein XENOCAPTIV_011188, partial [Xenoophorus captivus]